MTARGECRFDIVIVVSSESCVWRQFVGATLSVTRPREQRLSSSRLILAFPHRQNGRTGTEVEAGKRQAKCRSRESRPTPSPGKQARESHAWRVWVRGALPAPCSEQANSSLRRRAPFMTASAPPSHRFMHIERSRGFFLFCRLISAV